MDQTETKQIHTVRDYTNNFGLAPTDPLVGIVDLTTANNWSDEFHLTFDIYAVQLMGILECRRKSIAQEKA